MAVCRDTQLAIEGHGEQRNVGLCAARAREFVRGRADDVRALGELPVELGERQRAVYEYARLT